MSVSELMLRRFRGRIDHVAVCDDGVIFHPVKLDSPLRPAWLESEHLSGKRCLGFYLLEVGNTVWCSAVDFDNKPEHPDENWRSKAEQLYFALGRMGLSPVVELSQSGTAAHVWLFFSEPTPAWIPRAFWRAVSLFTEVPMIEVYPRQDVLKDDGLGNLIRYPLWKQSRFVDVENEWATIEPEAALSCALTDGPQLRMLGYDLGFGELKPDVRVAEIDGATGLSQRVLERVSRPGSLLAKRWAGEQAGLNDPSRSALVQSIACELVRTYVPTVEIENAIRFWCKQNGYEKGERDDWIGSTVAKAYEFVLNRGEKKSIVSGTMKDAALAYLDLIATDQPRHVPSGLEAIDASIDGVGFGEMCIIAARPNHGKTAFALQWIDQASAAGLPCLVISEEMSKAELGHRALCRIVTAPERDWRDVLPHAREEVEQHYSYRKTVHVVESVSTIERAEEIIDQYCNVYGVRLVVVDYMQLLGSRQAGRYEIVTDVSQRLKRAATRNECAMLALSQLNRGIEDSKRKWKPKLSDLRESGSIEQDADLVLFLVWPHRCDENNDKDTYVVYCAKRRNGALRHPVVVTTFNPERQSFGNTLAKEMDNYSHEFDEYR